MISFCTCLCLLCCTLPAFYQHNPSILPDPSLVLLLLLLPVLVPVPVPLENATGDVLVPLKLKNNLQRQSRQLLSHVSVGIFDIHPELLDHKISRGPDWVYSACPEKFCPSKAALDYYRTIHLGIFLHKCDV